MASLLRSSKFVRYVAGFARHVVVNPPREFDTNIINGRQYVFTATQQQFASQASAQHDQNLDFSLRRLDQDVRKTGRISRKDIDEIIEELQSTRQATSSQSLLAIRCCGNLVPEELPEVRTKLVQEIWGTLHKLKIPVDISHYNALLKVYLDNEHPFSPTDFLADLEGKGIEPNRVTYQRLIARYCQDGNIEGATRILEFMREKQLPVNEAVFNTLIFGHAQAGDMDSAEGIINVMIQAGLEPSSDTYATLLCGYAKKGDIESITRVIGDCESKDILIPDRDYLEVIYSLATNGHSEHISIILSKVRKLVGYNQDATNVILRLINKGEEDAAFLVTESMVRSTREDGTPMPIGQFFIKQLIKANRPLDKIIRLCEKLEQSEMYERAFLLAAETSLQRGNDKLAYPLLSELQNRNIRIRQHFFWPLIIAKAGDESGNGIVEVLLEMQKFGTAPNTETLRDYVIPNLKCSTSEILEKLRDANVPAGTTASCLVHNLLLKHNIKEAAAISSQVSAYYDPDLLRRSLTTAFYRTRDLNSYIRLLRNIYENLDRRAYARGEDEQEASSGVDKIEIVGNFILDLRSNSEFLNVITDVLQGLIEEGLSISTTAAEKLQEKIGEKMTEEISQLLSKLSSGDLTPVPVARKLPSYTPSHQMNTSQLERLISNLEAKGQETNGLKRQLLTLYHREKNLEKTEALLADLEKSDFVYSPGIYAQLTDLYACHDNLEKAFYYFNKLKEVEGGSFKMDESKIIQLASALIKSGQFDEGIKILEQTPKDNRPDERNYAYMAQVWRLLNSLAEQGRSEDLNKLFDTLIKAELIDVTNVLLGPLIKVHLLNKDIDKALEKFEWSVNNFRATPWKNELACHLIQSEDAEKLQKLTDLSTSVHGEINSLYDLVFAFVECGRVRQARKILETPGLQNRPQRINTACERYQQEGKVKNLEGLKDATKDLNHIDRNDIFYQLLLSYIKQEDVEKALGLWTQMQEEDVMPTEQFLHKLGTYLKGRQIEVPFTIPHLSDETVELQQKADIQTFRQKIKAADVDEALKIFKRQDRGLTSNDYSSLIEKLTQADRIGEATKVTLQAFDNNVIPLTRVFRFLLNKLANSGDVDSLTQIGSRISKDVKRDVSFDNKLCHANLIAGKVEEYLDQLEKTIDNAKDEDLQTIGEQFPRGGASGILERHPELSYKFENIAIKYSQKDIVAPLNVLWTHYFVTKNDAKAGEIWDKYLKNAPRIMFQKIVHHARDTKDEDLIKKLIDQLKESNVTEGAIGNAYSCFLDILVAKEKSDELSTVFETALNEVGLEHINRTAVLRVKDMYEKLGKPFNHNIPPKNAKNVNATLSSEDV